MGCKGRYMGDEVMRTTFKYEEFEESQGDNGRTGVYALLKIDGGINGDSALNPKEYGEIVAIAKQLKAVITKINKRLNNG